MRKTFEQDLLEVLADNIEIVGLINPIIVNKKNKNKRLILVAGERRVKAYKILYDRYGNKFSSIPANVYHNLSEEQHSALQYAENSYVPVNPAEAAESYAKLYEKMRKKYNSLKKPFSKTFFAKVVGRSISTVSDALKFVDLEAEIKEWTKKKLLNYGAAVEITKIKNRVKRRNIAIVAMYKNYNTDQVKDVVDKILLEESSGQTNMFEGFELESQSVRKKTIVDYLGKSVHAAGINSAQYMMKVQSLSKQKIDYKPLKLRSVQKMLKKIQLVSGEMLKYKRKGIEDNYKGPIIRIEYPAN
jgi:ParB/RepB/Spo0J family partition protein